MLLFPSTHRIKVPGGTRREVQLAGSGMVEIWTAPSPAVNGADPHAYVLRFGGNGERAEDGLLRERGEWRGLPVGIWAMNYPGFGSSTGPATLQAIAPAALAAYDALRQCHPGKPILISGFSMGATAALYVAVHRPVAGLLLHNPPPLRQVIMGEYGWWNLWLLAGAVAAQVPSQLDSLQNAGQVHVPAVFVISGNDEIIPPAYQRQVVKAYAGPKRVILADGAYHNSDLTSAADAQLQSELRWLWSAGPPTATPGTAASE